MEYLPGVKTSNLHHKVLENWTYFDLASKIEYKAKTRGLQVIKVQPNCTSQRCPHFGGIDKERVSQAIFHCQTCHHKTNADLNTARNIGLKGIEPSFKNSCKSRKIKQNLPKRFHSFNPLSREFFIHFSRLDEHPKAKR